MKAAILANTVCGYVRPMALGLQRMFSAIGVESRIFWDGHSAIRSASTPFGRSIRDRDNHVRATKIASHLLRKLPSNLKFVRQLRRYDVVINVNSIAPAYLKESFNDAILRSLLPETPLVLYDVFYLPTRGEWERWLREGSPEHGVPEGGHWGMERYDWYLVSSVVSETPMPPGPQPYSLIGINFEHESLYPQENSTFTALIDFEQPADLHERAIQIMACQATHTPYIALNGRYSMEQIRAIYRQCSLMFVAHRESFGLPVCEMQACGAYIASPYAEWCPSHWIKDDLSKPGPGEMSPNFLIYDNDLNTLIREIERVKANHDPHRVRETFKQYHPQLLSGDLRELHRFVTKVERGVIHSDLHHENGWLSKFYVSGTSAAEPSAAAAVPAATDAVAANS